MRFVACALFLTIPLMLSMSARRARAQNLPSCNRQVMTLHGNEITIGLEQLSKIIDQNLKGAHSQFSELNLTAEGDNKLKVSGKNNGTPVEIIGPLEVESGGALKLHADKILQNGNPEKGLMALTGKSLADYAHFSYNEVVSAQGNNLFIHPDPLLNLSADATGVSLDGSSLTLTFASQPCR
jgi:hypothetical protein